MDVNSFVVKYNIETVWQTTPNYNTIPVSAFPFTIEMIKDVNELLRDLYNEHDLNILARTKSGGIRLSKKLKFPAYDLRVRKLGIELTYIGYPAFFRLQLRNSSKDLFEQSKMKISGRNAFLFFKNLCFNKFGINLDDLAEDNKKIAKNDKKTMPKAMIQFYDKRLEEKHTFGTPPTYENMHHIDFHSSYMSGLVNCFPKFKGIVNYLYNKRKEDNLYYKAALNLTFGYMQSEYVGYKWAWLSSRMIEDNNKRILELTQRLIDNGFRPILYNTDGIWYQSLDDKPYHGEGEGDGIGQWHNDHVNCKFRAKSKGCYEFIENGTYYPVVRGMCPKDLEESDRSKWKWGAIFEKNAVPYTFKLQNGYIIYIEGDNDGESEEL